MVKWNFIMDGRRSIWKCMLPTDVGEGRAVAFMQPTNLFLKTSRLIWSVYTLDLIIGRSLALWIKWNLGRLNVGKIRI